jgi:hypothetical protein
MCVVLQTVTATTIHDALDMAKDIIKTMPVCFLLGF